MNLVNWTLTKLELRILFEALHISLRHPRYLLITIILWGLGITQPINSRKWRWSFVLLQFIDDLLDGHRKSIQPPLEIVKNLKLQIQFRQYSKDFWGQTLQILMSDFNHDPNCWDAKYEFLNVIDNMILDYHRRIEKKLLPEAKLKNHHRETFIPSVNLLLMSMGAKSRINPIPEFVDLLSWCSVVRDLEDDQSRGLNNIPKEFIESGEQKKWLNEQSQLAKKNWALASEKLSLLDPRAQKIVSVFLKSSKKYLDLSF